MNTTVAEMKKEKKALENDISEAIAKFGEKYKVEVTKVKIELESYYPGIYKSNWKTTIKIEI